MSSRSIYRSSKGEVRVLEMYDRFQADVGVQLEDHTVNTRFGTTHVLATGPENAQPVVITHGGNQTNPHALRNLSPLLKLNQYRVYAPDTIGHPGKSAQTRLSPRDSSYGRWLDDVLDGLNLESAAFVGGSFGAGIILRLAAYAPQRISKLALFVPSGIVRVPLSSMVFRIGGPYLRYLLSPSRERLIRAAQWMGDDLNEDDLALLDQAATLSLAVNNAFYELRSLYLRDMRLRVPQIVKRYDDVTFTFEDILKGDPSLAKYL